MRSHCPVEIRQCCDALNLPLINLRVNDLTAIRDLTPEALRSINSQQAKSLARRWGDVVKTSTIVIADLADLISKATSNRSFLEADARITIRLSCSGRSGFDMNERLELDATESLFHLNQSGEQCMNYGSGIRFQLELERLLRRLRVIGGRDKLAMPADGVLAHLSLQQSEAYLTALQFVDQ